MRGKKKKSQKQWPKDFLLYAQDGFFFFRFISQIYDAILVILHFFSLERKISNCNFYFSQKNKTFTEKKSNLSLVRKAHTSYAKKKKIWLIFGGKFLSLFFSRKKKVFSWKNITVLVIPSIRRTLKQNNVKNCFQRRIQLKTNVELVSNIDF